MKLLKERCFVLSSWGWCNHQENVTSLWGFKKKTIITYLCFHQFLEFGATVNSTYTYSEIAAIIEAIWVTFV